VSGALAALLGFALMAAPDAAERTVHVRVLQRLHPHAALFLGPARHAVEASASVLRVDGARVAQPLQLEAGAWRVLVPGEAPRHYTGGLSLRAVQEELVVVLELPLEAYVESVVASETVPGTPEQALRAQAVVARSFLLAQGPRHKDADACDLAHCQVLRGHGVSASHLAAARAATRATRGQVLVLSSGLVAETPFHADCGGHTADPVEVLGSAFTGAAAVEDSGCAPNPWQAVVSLRRFQATLGAVLSGSSSESGGQGDLEPATLALLTGQGGYVVRVVAPGGGRSARGDVVARALDKTLGWGAVRSGRFTFHSVGSAVLVHGEGLGHGVGLCQAGAAWRAAHGETYAAILQHYFPFTSLR
jgi:stage II sporulation protein D